MENIEKAKQIVEEKQHTTWKFAIETLAPIGPFRCVVKEVSVEPSRVVVIDTRSETLTLLNRSEILALCIWSEIYGKI